MSEHAIPYSFGEARATAHKFQQAQLAGETALKEASKELAAMELKYRKALALKIVEVHEGGAAWTVAQDLARGDDEVAHLRYLRDVAKGVYEATQTASWRHTANRKDCLELITWSRTVAPDGQQSHSELRTAA